MRVTAACPEALIEDANHLAMCLALSEADGETYRTPCGWQDANGNLYAAASFDAREDWVVAAQSPLVRPEWDTGVKVNYEDEYGDVVTYIRYIIDMGAATKAQQSLVFYVVGSEKDAPKANPLSLVAIGGCEGIEALSLMGLTTKLDEPMEECP